MYSRVVGAEVTTVHPRVVCLAVVAMVLCHLIVYSHHHALYSLLGVLASLCCSFCWRARYLGAQGSLRAFSSFWAPPVPRAPFAWVDQGD